MRAPIAIFDTVKFWRTLMALVLGTASGFVAWKLHMPLPWMLGPLIGVTVACLARAPLYSPDRLRPVTIPVIGVLLGSSITPAILDAIVHWSLTVLLLFPFLIAAAAVSYLIYRRIGRYDRTTAYFCAMPGGLNDMLIMGAAAGGVERKIALAHALRIFCVIVFVVLFFGLVLGVTSTGARNGNWVSLTALAPWDWLVLGACAAIGVPLGTRIHLPAAPVFGPMILSGLAHVTELVTIAPPSVIVIIAQIVIGTTVGCRFLGAELREVGRDMGLGLLSSLAMLVVAVVFALLVSTLTGVEMTQSFLAYSPGGLAEMSLLALAMGQDVAYVSVMHVVRLTVVIGAAASMFRMLSRVSRPED
jgi:hypothetical protein